MHKNDLKNKFVKRAINKYYAIDSNGELVIYNHEDLNSFSRDAYKKGEKYFYCEPVDKDMPTGKLKISEPLYEYSLTGTLTEKEFNLLFND